jgi:hypothetical protein
MEACRLSRERYAEIVIAAGPFEQDGGAGDAYDCRHEHRDCHRLLYRRRA